MKIKLLVILSLLFAIYISVEAKIQNAAPQGTVDLKKNSTHKSHRPKAPGLQRITCVYDGENLVVDFVIPEGQCELTVRDLDNGRVVTESFDSSDLYAEVFVGSLSDCEIELSTSLGHTYSGVLYVGNE